MALDAARDAASAGDVPVGCVIVRDDTIISVGSNEVERRADPTAHAEMVAIQRATESLGSKFLDNCTLYVTLEPCAMCAGAIVLARLPTVVYGADDNKTGAARSLYEILDDRRLNHRCVVRTGILEQESSALLKDFFAKVPRSVPSADQGGVAATAPVNTVVSGLPTTPLRIVPTPIGNIEDITVRGLKALRSADVIVCEDTRHTGQLLKRYGGVAARLVSNHEHNEEQRTTEIMSLLRSGKNVCLVSDAGMPGISDPGHRAIVACRAAGIPVEVLPGASAAVTAVVGSGLPTDRILFVGFPPQKKGRQAWLLDVLSTRATIVLYESPYRIDGLLEDLIAAGGGDRTVVVARELTKLHEEYLQGTSETLRREVARRGGGLKGECVVIIGQAED